jgi:WG containing repeat
MKFSFMKALMLFLFSASYIHIAKAQTPFFPHYSEGAWTYIDVAEKKYCSLDTNLYDVPQPFYEGRAAVLDKKTKLYGYIDEKGKWIIKPKYTFAEPFNDGLAIVGIACDDKCYNGNEGLMFFGYTKVIDKSGKVVLDDNAQDPEPYKRFWFDFYNENNMLRVIHGLSVGDIKTMMNRKGEMVGIRTGMCCPFVSDDVIVYNTYDGVYFTDTKGEKIKTFPTGLEARPFSEGYAWCFDTANVYSLYDKKMALIFKMKTNDYYSVSKVGEKSFVAQNEKGAYYFDLKGKPLFETVFYSADPFSNGLAHVVGDNNAHFYIDKKGKTVITIEANDEPNQIYGAFTKQGYALITDTNENRQTVVMGMVLRNGHTFFNKKKD